MATQYAGMSQAERAQYEQEQYRRRQFERIKANSKIIWPMYEDLDFEIEGDPSDAFLGFVRPDFGDHYGDVLIMTPVYNSEDKVWRDLDRMLNLRARQVESGLQMTEEERIEIHGGLYGQHKNLLRRFAQEKEEHSVRA